VLRLAALSALAFSVAALIQYVLPTPTFCAPGGGCDIVRKWANARLAGLPAAQLLPMVGVMGFTTLFVGSLVPQRRAVRITGALALVGGLGAAVLLILQPTVIGAWCWLCLGVDLSALVAGGAGLAMLRRSAGADPKATAQLRSPYWAGAALATSLPLAWFLTVPDPGIPPVIERLYRPGAVNVVEVADFECPYCRALNPVLKRALADAEGEVNLVRVIVPLSFHIYARDAARAYHCAGRAGQGEAMADRLFEAEDLTREGLAAEAAALGLDAQSFAACLDDPAIEQRIAEDERLAEESQNQGLPTVFIGGRTLLGFDPERGEATVREAVREARANQGGRVRYWPIPGAFALALAAFFWGRGGRRPSARV
jgi:protein-disulfide isomerase/uncharacterized membrane protein